MTYEEINEMMQEVGLPFAYHHFAEGESPNPPFLLFLSPGEHTFGADNHLASSSYTAALRFNSFFETSRTSSSAAILSDSASSNTLTS